LASVLAVGKSIGSNSWPKALQLCLCQMWRNTIR